MVSKAVSFDPFDLVRTQLADGRAGEWEEDLALRREHGRHRVLQGEVWPQRHERGIAVEGAHVVREVELVRTHATRGAVALLR